MKRVIKNKVFIIIILIFEILFLAYSPSMAATIPTSTTTIYDYWPTADSTDGGYGAYKTYDVSSLEKEKTFSINQYVSMGIISETIGELLEDNLYRQLLTNWSGLFYSEETRLCTCNTILYSRCRYL